MATDQNIEFKNRRDDSGRPICPAYDRPNCGAGNGGNWLAISVRPHEAHNSEKDAAAPQEEVCREKDG